MEYYKTIAKYDGVVLDIYLDHSSEHKRISSDHIRRSYLTHYEYSITHLKYLSNCKTLKTSVRNIEFLQSQKQKSKNHINNVVLGWLCC